MECNRKALGRHVWPSPGSVSTGLWYEVHVCEIVRAGLGMSWTGVSGAYPEPRTPTQQQQRQSTIGSTAPSLAASSGSKEMTKTLQNTVSR